jgi:hypothetical protein
VVEYGIKFVAITMAALLSMILVKIVATILCVKSRCYWIVCICIQVVER